MASAKALLMSLNKGFSKFFEKKYPVCSNVRVTAISEKLIITNKKSLYSNKSLFLTKSVKVVYLYDLEHVPSDWEEMCDIAGTAYVTPKEFTYITLMS